MFEHFSTLLIFFGDIFNRAVVFVDDVGVAVVGAVDGVDDDVVDVAVGVAVGVVVGFAALCCSGVSCFVVSLCLVVLLLM